MFLPKKILFIPAMNAVMFGILVACFMSYAAFEHNPSREYYDEVEGISSALLTLALLWFFLVAIAVLIIELPVWIFVCMKLNKKNINWKNIDLQRKIVLPILTSTLVGNCACGWLVWNASAFINTSEKIAFYFSTFFYITPLIFLIEIVIFFLTQSKFNSK